MKRILSILGYLPRILAMLSLTVIVASCGGSPNGSPGAVSGGNGAAPTTATFKTLAVVESWTFCANKDQLCSFSGTRRVRYGANGTYNYQTATDSIMCSDPVFGDPVPGVDKTCDYENTPATTTWVFCANKDQLCSFSGTRRVRYGANGTYNYQTATDSIMCSDPVFGDPVPGVDKTCDYENTSTSNWTFCANEHDPSPICSFSGTRQVRYGANGTYNYQTATGSIACNNNVFGDPLPGAQKACDYSNAEVPLPGATWTFCANENDPGPCSFSGTRQVRYGANGTYNYQTATGSIACNNNVFGDPLPGAQKACDYSSLQSDPTQPPPQPGAVQPIPTNVASNSFVDLQCGQIYQGTLDLNGKSNITVRTVGKTATCGNASITPASAITGWTLYQGNIYSAPIAFPPVQVSIAGNPVDAAHWPDGPQIWASPGSSPPNGDVDGATLVYLENQSVILTQTISGTAFSTAKDYYVEGKLWMLDSPGEWAISNGRLYVWAPDGQSPEGRVWAAPDSKGINADSSSNITIDGIKIFSATDGISGEYSTSLKVLNSDITNSARDGIWAKDSTGLLVDSSTVTNSVSNGIDGYYWIVGAVITNSSVTNTGTVGRPKPTDAGIMFGDGKGNRIQSVRVINSGYHGISVLHNQKLPDGTPSQVLSSLVDTACVRLTDCGGIYTGDHNEPPPRNHEALGMTIDGNTVTNVKGTHGIAIYLDDYANDVTVNNNVISNSTTGMVIHNGYNNKVTNNTFDSNVITHLGLALGGGRTGGTIRDIVVTNNTFKSTNNNVWTYNLEAAPDPDLKAFATYDYNTYTSTNPSVFGRTWQGPGTDGVTTSYTDWKIWSGGDAHSTMNGAP